MDESGSVDPAVPGGSRSDEALQRVGVGTFALTRHGGIHGDARFRELLGLGPEDPDDTVEQFAARLHPEDGDRVMAALLETLRRGTQVTTTCRVGPADRVAREITVVCSAADGEGDLPAEGVGVVYETSAETVEQARVAHVMDNLSSGFLTVDREWRFTYVNAAGQRLLKSETLVGRSVWEAFPEQLGTPFEHNYRRAAETGEPVMFRAYYPFPLDTWYEVRMHAIPDGLAVQFLDVTAEHEQQERIRKQARRSALLAQVSHELSRSLDAERALAALMPLVVPALADWGVVLLVGQGDGHWRERARPVAWLHADPARAAELDAVVPVWLSQLPESADLGAVIDRRQNVARPVTVESFEANTLPGAARDLFASLRPGATATIPLVADGRVLAVLALGWSGEGGVPDDEYETAVEIASRAALLLDNARLYAIQRDQAAEMARALLADALTGLANRTLLDDRLQQAAHRAKRFGHALAAIFIDLDRFKRVNDQYGHAAGDALLRAVAGRLSGLVRATDTLARVSGDEFVVLCEDENDAGPLAERIVVAFREPFLADGLTLVVTASAGVAHAEPGSAVDGLIVAADAAMYQAKRAGGDAHRVVARQDRDRHEHQQDGPSRRRETGSTPARSPAAGGR